MFTELLLVCFDLNGALELIGLEEEMLKKQQSQLKSKPRSV